MRSTAQAAILIKASRLPPGRVPAQTLAALLTSDARALEQHGEHAVALYTAPMVLVIIISVMISVAGWACLPILFIVVASLVAQLLIARKQHLRPPLAAQAQEKSTRVISEVIRGLQQVKMYAWEPIMLWMLDDKRSVYLRALAQDSLWTSLSGFLSQITPLLGVMIAVAIASDTSVQPSFMAILALFNVLRMHLAQFSAAMRHKIPSNAAIERIYQFLALTEPTEDDLPVRVPLHSLAARNLARDGASTPARRGSAADSSSNQDPSDPGTARTDFETGAGRALPPARRRSVSATPTSSRRPSRTEGQAGRVATDENAPEYEAALSAWRERTAAPAADLPRANVLCEVKRGTFGWWLSATDSKAADASEDSSAKSKKKKKASSSKGSSRSVTSTAVYPAPDGDSKDASGSASSKVAVSTLEFDVNAGEIMAIAGAQGSGKSSVLHAITGSMQRLEGTAFIRGEYAYIPQQPWIFAGSIRDNITLGRAFSEDLYAEVVAACCLDRDIERKADGHDTIIGEAGDTKLSASMRARIALARAVYSNADVYLFDSLFTSLDDETAAMIWHGVIVRILSSRGKAVILTVDPKQAAGMLPRCHTVLGLKDGAQAFFGQVADLPPQLLASAAVETGTPRSSELGDGPEAGTSTSATRSRRNSTGASGPRSGSTTGRRSSTGRERRVSTAGTNSDADERSKPRRKSRRASVTGTSSNANSRRASMEVGAAAPAADSSGSSDHVAIPVNAVQAFTGLEVETVRKPIPFSKQITVPALQEEVKLRKLEGLRSIPRRTWKAYIKAGGGWPAAVLVVLMVLLSRGVRLVSDWYLTVVIDAQVLYIDSGKGVGPTLPLVGTYVGIVIAAVACIALRTALFRVIARATANRMFRAALVAVLRVPLPYVLKVDVRRLITKFSTDMPVLDAQAAQALETTAEAFAQLALSLLLLACIHPGLVPLIAILAFFGYVLCTMYDHTSDVYRKIEQSAERSLSNHGVHLLAGSTVIRSMDAGGEYQDLGDKAVDNNTGTHMASFYLVRWLHLRFDFVSSVLVCLTAMFCVGFRDTIQPSLLGLSLVYALGLAGSSQLCYSQWRALTSTFEAVSNVESLSHLPKEEEWVPLAARAAVAAQPVSVVEATEALPSPASADGEKEAVKPVPTKPSKQPSAHVPKRTAKRIKAYPYIGWDPAAATLRADEWPTKGEVQIQQAATQYELEDERPAFSDVTLHLAAGSSTGIVGAPGSGKSALAFALQRMLPLERGNITIDGVDIATLPLAQLRDAVGVVPSQPLIIGGLTLLHNLDPLDKYQKDDIQAVLKQCGLKELVDSWPLKLKTVMEDGGANMPIASRHMVSIARVMLTKPKIVVVDGLDKDTTGGADGKLIQAIEQCIKGSTSLVLSRDMPVVAFAQYKLQLSHGSLSPLISASDTQSEATAP